MNMGRAIAALLAFIAIGSAGRAADFYDGKTIRIVTGGNPGGGYDAYTRLIASYIGRHIPGSPALLVQNMPEGSGIGAANYIFNIAKKDGTDLGQFNRDALIESLLGQQLAKFTLQDFNWIGTPANYSANVFVVVIRAALPYHSMADLRAASTPLNFGNMGTVLAYLVKDAMGANLKIIEGYKGDLGLALQRGEIDGLVTDYALVKLAHPDWLANGLIRIIAQYGGDRRLPELPDVPTAQELALTPDDLALIRFCELGLHLGFPFAAPPGVPPDRVELLRRAFAATVEDADYVSAVRKANLEYSPMSGEKLADDVVEATQASPATIARYKMLAETGGRR
ncbi:MAG TPA: tripartite tricarboxylate transporter substrate-binding protein [Beijerinckiaceae bacterium]|nr:tripartite tricarboxylate transporter substrate-binding protein [Beijerinckiaceae bacterium]